jgi:small subunit ribosomal protein S6
MKKYEVAFIIKPTLDEATIKATIEQVKKIYADFNSEIVDEFDMGMRELAYEIQKNKSGYYYFLNVMATSEANEEFLRVTGISESIIRQLIINIDDINGSTLDMLRK